MVVLHPPRLTVAQCRDKKISIPEIRLLLIRVIQFKRLVVEYMTRIQMSSQAVSVEGPTKITSQSSHTKRFQPGYSWWKSTGDKISDKRNMLSIIIVVPVFAFFDPSWLNIFLDNSSTIISLKFDISSLTGVIEEFHSIVLNNWANTEGINDLKMGLSPNKSFEMSGLRIKVPMGVILTPISTHGSTQVLIHLSNSSSVLTSLKLWEGE